MSSFWLTALLALAPPPPAGTAQNPTGQLLQMLGTFVMLGLMFYFAMIRPQQKKTKELAELMKALKSGDKIITNSGIVGVVVGVKDKTLSIRSADSKFEVLKSSVAEVTEKSSGASES